MKPIEWDARRVELVKRAYCPKASPAEFELFIEHCKRLGLAPEAGQIFFVPRWDSKERREVYRTLVSLQGLRTVADRTGKLRGQIGPLFLDERKEWREYWVGTKPPTGAKASILKAGCTEPFTHFVRWESYVQTKKDGSPAASWKRMPELMLGKCAVAGALRCAFPDLEGLYTPEEFADTEDVAQDGVAASEANAKSPERLNQIVKAFGAIGIDVGELERIANTSLSTLDAVTIERLKGIYRDLRDGKATKETYLPPDKGGLANLF